EVHLPAATSGVSQQQDARPVRLRPAFATQPRPGARTGPGRYLDERAPVLIVGPCGTGKSHLAQALGHCAVRQGVDVTFATCTQLTAALNTARATGGYERKLANLALARVASHH